MFRSRFEKLLPHIPMPPYRGLQILLMPIILGDNKSIPEKDCIPMLDAMAFAKPEHCGQVVYLTIDQKLVKANKSHRRPRMHVDGYHLTESQGSGGTWGGGGGGWGGGRTGETWMDGTGLLTVSDVPGCRAWNQIFYGEPAVEGDCEHLRNQCKGNGTILEPRQLYWFSPSCVHESLIQKHNVQRTFIRVSLPSKCDWYEGCTPNPLGIMPTGKIQKQRRFLNEE